MLVPAHRPGRYFVRRASLAQRWMLLRHRFSWARKLKPRAMVLSPHWFLDQEVSEYVEMIQREIGWKYPRLSYPGESTNCYLNFIAAHNSLKHYGYTHYHVEMSKLIRQGLMSRDKALQLLEPNWDTDLLNRIAEPLDFKFS